MIRLILFLSILALAALGLSWLADRPGEISITWQGYQIETSVLVGMAALLAACIVFLILWSILRFVLRLPSFIALSARVRRRNKGYQALTRGMPRARHARRKNSSDKIRSLFSCAHKRRNSRGIAHFLKKPSRK